MINGEKNQRDRYKTSPTKEIIAGSIRGTHHHMRVNVD